MASTHSNVEGLSLLEQRIAGHRVDCCRQISAAVQGTYLRHILEVTFCSSDHGFLMLEPDLRKRFHTGQMMKRQDTAILAPTHQ